MPTTESALVRVESITAVELFKPGNLDPILNQIEEEVREEASKLDIATEASRKAIASLAYKIARSKTFLDTQGKALVADEKRRISAIDSERRRVWEKLEALQSEVRAPLTEWEERQKARVARYESAIAEIVEGGRVSFGATTAQIEAALQKVLSVDPATFEEFSKRAAEAQAHSLNVLKEQLAASRKADEERAEAERLRKEAEERTRKEREEAIAKEAREKAEAKAREAAEKARRAADAERERIEREKHEAEARAKQAEARRVAEQQSREREAREAEERHQRELKEAAERAEREKKAAIEADRKRREDQERREREEQERRERNRRHCAQVNREAKTALMRACNLSADQAEEVVKRIAKGEIDHVTITY